MIYHITSASAWETTQRTGTYAAVSLASEGFIHLSTLAQVLWVANRFYRGQSGLVLLAVAEDRLAAELRYEESEPGQRFPHLYGPLNRDAIVAAHPFAPAADGMFSLPDGV
ncbi:MAG: DUF952 domain-containing protein [Chloroflexales bacterium]